MLANRFTLTPPQVAGLIAIAAWSIGAASRAAAQRSPTVQYGEVTVEVMGLRRWSLRMLQDSLARHEPGQTLADAACMATLRYKMGFADASVIRYSGFDRANPSKAFVSVRVIEPQRRPIWRSLSSDSYESLLPAYAPLIVPVTDARGSIWINRLLFGFQVTDSVQRERLFASADPQAREDYFRVATFVRANAAVEARDRAVRVLDSSAAPGNRIAAALALMSHADDDHVWYALVRALRDPHEGVRAAAAMALARLPRRSIDWTPAAADLRLLLGGANVGEMESLMRMLMESGIRSTLAAPLLAKNASWLLPMLDSQAPITARRTREFLVVLNGGVDRGAGSAGWRAWLERL
ncbi:hypothetical protein [Gemmatimonas sp.]